MNLEKVSAERDALVQALKRAEEEISRARAAQKHSEARLAESHVSRPTMIAPAKNDGNQAVLAQAQAAQKRAEAQLQAQKAELEQLRAAMTSLKAENDQLRDQNDALREKEKQKRPDAASPVQPNRNEVKSLRQQLESSWAEIQRLRGLVVKVASEARGGTIPPELQGSPKPDPRTAPAPRHTPLPTAASKSKADVDTTPRSGVHRAA